MTTVTGDMALLMDVLGHRQGDRRILDAIALLSPDMTVEEFDFDGTTSTYFVFEQAGTDLLFEDGVLVSVMVRTRTDHREPTYGTYPRPAALVDALAPTATRAEVTALLGRPERAGPNFDRYEVNRRLLHVEFDADQRIARLSALLHRPG